MKRTGLVLSSIGLKLCLFVLATSAAMGTILLNPSFIKDQLRESGVYGAIVPSIIEESKRSLDNQANDLPLDDPEIQAAANEAFPPESIEEVAQSVIDQSYAWLDGSQAEPNIVIDLSQEKQAFAEGVGAYAERRYNTLPRCTAAQIRAININDIDPFNLECSVAIVPGSVVNLLVQQQITNSREFLPESTVSSADLPKNADGQTIFEQLSFMPVLYALSQFVPAIIGAIAALLALLVVLLAKRKRDGIRLVGISFLGVGIFIGVLGAIVYYFFVRINTTPVQGMAVTEEMQAAVAALLRALSWQYARVILWFAGVYAVVGAALLGLVWYLRRRNPDVPASPPEDTVPPAAIR